MKRPKIESIGSPTLFEMGKPEKTAKSLSSPNIERPYSEAGLYLGTSAFTAAGWQGSFYPPGMQSREYLTHYATQFRTVEVDSTFYGTPSPSTVMAWNERTPDDFIFSVKVPQVITHEKVLVDCQPEFDEFIDRMKLLGEKTRPFSFSVSSLRSIPVQKRQRVSFTPSAFPPETSRHSPEIRYRNSKQIMVGCAIR
jgi:hypothetical protein